MNPTNARRPITIAAAALLCAALGPPALAAEPAEAEAAERLLEVTRVEQTMEQMYAQMPQMLAGLFPPEMVAEDRETMDAVMGKIMAMMDERIGYAALKDDYVGIYADAYSAEDMNELSDFFETELGQRYLDQTPEIMAASVALVQERTMGMMPEIMETVQAEVEAAQGAK